MTSTNSPQSSVQSPQDTPEPSQRAPRAPARVTQESITVQLDAAPDARNWLQDLAKTLNPPQIWHEHRPSLEDIYRYARYGSWTKAGGLLRVLGCGWAWIALVCNAVLYYLGWILERPSRTAAAAVLYLVLVQTPVGPWLPYGTALSLNDLF